MPSISERINGVQTPIIPEVADLIDENPGTISLGQGVVHYSPPKEIVEGIRAFSDSAMHHYQAVEGIAMLREKIAEKTIAENNINPECYEIVVTAGSNMGFLNAILAVCDPGDEVILLSPWYFNHEMAIRIANCTPVSVATDSSFKPDIVAISAAITPRTRAVVTVSPNNPTGAVYSKTTISTINQLCLENNLYHISDEAYEYFCYDGAAHYSPASIDTAENHTISLFSTSKSYALANWRIGYMMIPKHLFKPIRKIQDTNLICPPVISQFVALECLKSGRNYCLQNQKGIESSRTHLKAGLKTLSDVTFPKLEGAFYVLVQLPAVEMSDMEIVRFLIEQHGVAVIPGVAFGIRDRKCIRVSYGALEPSIATTGINRLVAGIRCLLG